MQATLKGISLSSFSACFPTIAVAAPDTIKSLHTELLKKLEFVANNDFERIMREKKVVENLNGLEAVIEDAKRRKETSGHAGSASIV